MPISLVLIGKISEQRVYATGPHEQAKPKMYTKHI